MQVSACTYLRKEPNNGDWIQQNFPDIYRIGMQGGLTLANAIYATLHDGYFLHHWGDLGLVMGLFLVLTGPRGVIENKFVFQILDKITSIFRAIPSISSWRF